MIEIALSGSFNQYISLILIATMCACQIAAKDKYLAFFLFRNSIGCIFSAVHVLNTLIVQTVNPVKFAIISKMGNLYGEFLTPVRDKK